MLKEIHSYGTIKILGRNIYIRTFKYWVFDPKRMSLKHFIYPLYYDNKSSDMLLHESLFELKSFLNNKNVFLDGSVMFLNEHSEPIVTVVAKGRHLHYNNVNIARLMKLWLK